MTNMININRISIWIDGAGQPRCSPGSIEDTLNQVRQFIDRAIEWVWAVEDRHEIHKKDEVPPKDEKRVQRFMKMGVGRTQAIEWRREPLDF